MKLRLVLIALVALLLAVACTAVVRAVSVNAAQHVVRVADDDPDGWINGGIPPVLSGP